jgi:glutaminase
LKVSHKVAIDNIFDDKQRKRNAADIVFNEVAEVYGTGKTEYNQEVVNTALKVRDKAKGAATKEYETKMSDFLNTLINANTLKPTTHYAISENHHGV